MEMKTTKFKLPVTIEATAEDNPLITWMSFVFVDDEPNRNKQAVPKSAFSSLVKSGKLMPIKMQEGRIGQHSFSKPLGVIDSLTEDEDKVLGRAVLWNEERPSDISLLKEKWASEGVQISFELKYSEYEYDGNGVEWLLDPIVKAATIVAQPAYAGRTPVLSLAAKEEHSELPDDCFAYIESGGIVEEGFTNPLQLRHFPYKDTDGNISERLLKESLAEIEEIEFNAKAEVLQILESAKDELQREQLNKMTEEKIKELQEAEATLRERIEELELSLKEISEERDTLLEYKETREEEDAKAELLKSRLDILTEAGLEYNDEQIEAKSNFWISLEEDAFSTYVSELVELRNSSQRSGEASASIPNVSGEPARDTNEIETLRKYFESLNDKEE